MDAKTVKKIDNQLTYAIGYRNLVNIVVTALGFVMMMSIAVPQTPTGVLTGLVVFVIGMSNWYYQFCENLDTITVNEELNSIKG
jgi:hypothetical protein